MKFEKMPSGKPEKETESFLSKFLSKLSKEVRMKVLIPALIGLGFGVAGEQALEQAIKERSWKPDVVERDPGFQDKISAKENMKKVKNQAVLSCIANSDLVKELGPENMETLIKEMRKIDQQIDDINRVLAKMSKLPIEKLEKEKINYIYVVSENEQDNPVSISSKFKHAAKFEASTGGAHTINDGIFVTSRQIKSRQGKKVKVDKDKLIHTIAHEYLHVLSSELSADYPEYQLKIQIYNWPKKGVPMAFYEGATEYINCLVARQRNEGRIGIEKQIYDPAIRAALVISEIVGKDVFVRDYLNGDIKEIQANFDEKFGQGAFQKLLDQMRLNVVLEFGGHDNKSALRACWNEVSKFLEEKGVGRRKFEKAYTDLFFGNHVH